jgi:hypothetical protein
VYKCHSIRKCHSMCSVAWSADVWFFFRLAGPYIARCPGGPTVSIAFWSKFCPVDFNRDFAACLIFLPCTTSPAIFNPVFLKSRVLGFLLPFSIKAWLLKRVLQRYCQVHVLFDIVFPQIPDILFRLGVCNNPGKLSYRNDELVSFWREFFSFSTVKCYHHSSPFEWHYRARGVPYIYFHGLKSSL